MRFKRLSCITHLGDEIEYYGITHNRLQVVENNPKLNEFFDFLWFYRLDPVALFEAYEDNTCFISSNYSNKHYDCEPIDIIVAFDRYMEEEGISHYELARRMNVAGTYVSSLFKRRYSKSITLYTITRVSIALDLKLSDLFARAVKNS